ncbi:MAG: hypothetical protein JXA42_10805 [Anaerolineales bacterium]|nr:hypothetical protein [Anaerolineales bacterium]
MSFFGKLFGKKQLSSDPDGLYFYVQCDNCGEKLRIRANKKHDLMQDYESGKLVWNKEIMDSRCFQRMTARVVLDAGYRVESQNLEGKGHFISKQEYES